MTLSRAPRRLALVCGAFVALLALSGCVKMDMNLTLQPDDTVDGTVVMAISKSLPAVGGQTPQQLAESLQKSMLTGAEGGKSTSKPYDDGKYIGTETTIASMPLKSFASTQTGSPSITREGDEFVVKGSIDLSTAALSGLGADQIPGGLTLDTSEIRMAITFPGKVTSHNGTLKGHTVTWTAKPGATNEINARGGANASDGALPIWVIALIVVAGLAIVAVGAVVWAASRKKPAPEATVAPESIEVGSGPEADASAAQAEPVPGAAVTGIAPPLSPPPAPPAPPAPATVPPTVPPATPAAPPATPEVPDSHEM